MLVFVDDSGDPGFKINKGSPRYFIIALVIFSDHLEAEKAAVAIKELRRSLKLHDYEEFKFSKSRQKIRVQFLTTISQFNFKVRALVVDKLHIRSTELKKDKNSFYAYFIKTALKYSGPSLINASIKIDGSGDRDFRRGFLTYLRRELNGPDRSIIKYCKLVDSRENQLIQMADMIAGAIHRSYNKEKRDKDLYKGIIRRHIEDEWEFR